MIKTQNDLSELVKILEEKIKNADGKDGLAFWKNHKFPINKFEIIYFPAETEYLMDIPKYDIIELDLSHSKTLNYLIQELTGGEGRFTYYWAHGKGDFRITRTSPLGILKRLKLKYKRHQIF